ncbi:hypothetical protein SLE2022_157910 [Rubroshorea leprosula]
MEHFTNQFTTQPRLRVPLEGLQFAKLNEEDRDMLEAEFNEDEIREAVASCASDKAPGPDGFNFHFIKTIWSTIEGDIISFMKEFHKNGKLVKGLNASYITLIPKTKNPISLKEFRPISLVGCIYKILAKVLANRLRKIIGKVISTSQSAFMEGRHLVDSVLALNELVHDMKLKKMKSIIFKADFEKAFDSIDWNYLDSMQKQLGFGQKWCNWIKECLSSATVSVLVNGSPTKEFSMGMGLRQGDPLSPYLFIIVAEGLHALLAEAERKNLFKGVTTSTNAPISHLQFADDTVLLSEASVSSIRAIKFIMRWFEIMLGLKINFSKSILYGVNVDNQWIDMAAQILNCKHGSLPFTYLGLPVGGNPHRISFWKPMIEKFRSKLASWKGRLLSSGGRLTLLKSVLSALPLFYFSLFKVPKGILNELVKIQKNFLWGGLDNSKKIAWVNWEKACLAKSKGGLGIPNLAIRNTALLGKWWSKFHDVDENHKLWKNIIVCKYYEGNNNTSITSCITPKMSTIWRDILSIGRENERAKTCFIDGFPRRISDGAKTNFWSDVWLGSSSFKLEFP